MAGMKRKPGALPTVQETLLKKRKAAIEARAARTRQQASDRRLVKKQRSRGSNFVRIERVVKQGRLKDRDSGRLERLLRRPGYEPLAPVSVTSVAPSNSQQQQQQQQRPLLIIRSRGRASGMDTRVSRALRLFRLSRLNAAVFARPTPACLAVLRLLDPFVAWGCPDMRSVRELVYKRGHALVSGKPAPITDNAVVEDRLGQHGLLCIEDLVHELASCGPAFVQAASFLCPMRLRAPLGGWRAAEAKFMEPGSSGSLVGSRKLHCSRDEYMNSMLREMI